MTPPDEGIGRFPWFSPSPPPPPPPQVLRSRHGEEESVQAALESLCDIAEPKVSGIQSRDGRCERSLSWLPEPASFLAARVPQGISNMSRLSYGRPHPRTHRTLHKGPKTDCAVSLDRDVRLSMLWRTLHCAMRKRPPWGSIVTLMATRRFSKRF